jgi:hypothetical protein
MMAAVAKRLSAVAPEQSWRRPDFEPVPETAPICPARAGRSAMIQYVIERSVAGAGKLTDQQLREESLKSIETLARLGPRIQWLHSYVCEDKVY